jgi:hypothetical protein
MNKLFALELLGFENTVDFEVFIDGSFEWLSSDVMPTESEMQQAWDNHATAQVPIELGRKRIQSLDIADDMAERKRAEYVTMGSGQAMAYEQKFTEAQTFLSVGGDVNNYPFISMESTARGIDPTDFANIVIQKRNGWAQIGAQIEALRYTVKENIKVAANASTIASILESYQDNLDAL